MKDQIVTDNYRLYWEQINKDGLNIPLLHLDLTGAINIRTIIQVMKDVKKFTANTKERYIALADYRNVDINSTLKNLIIRGMESPLNNIVKMKNAAIVTFVMLDKKDPSSTFIKNTLSDINKPLEDSEPNYQYIFVSAQEEIYRYLPSILDENS